jgi:hypothetical protein
MNEFNEVKENIEQVIREIEKISPQLAAHLRKNIIMDDKKSTFCYAPSNDRMSDERIADIPKESSTGMLERT